MATITTNTFLDGGTARTAGEAWTMNGGVLTIRTDTRWHANAPAGMLGSIAATTVSATLGGGVLIDSSAVRWMPYDTGSGNVPAIGTTITQGGVSGYLLGVWANYTSAPTAVGVAMPASGYLKFREVTGGAFAVGALTGIGANATAEDRQGWIEIAQDQSVANTVPRLGYFRTRGGWFELDQVTSGTSGDVIQIPTNGGGAGTHVPALWIETGVGTGIFEKFKAVLSTWYLVANFGIDDRCKFVQTLGSGQVRIGMDSAFSSAGYVPPAGCRIRIPSNIGRQTSAANRALNLVPNTTIANRPDFTTTSAGEIDFEYFINDWYHLFTAPYKVRIIHCATFDIHTTSNEASPTELEDYCVGKYIAGAGFSAVNNPLGGTMTDCSFYRADAASNGHPWTMTGCSNYEFAGTIETGVIQYARSTGLISFSQCRNFSQTGVFRCDAVTWTPSTCANFDFERVRYIDRLTGTTAATTGKYALGTFVSSDNIIVRNIDFGGYTNVHPYNGVLNSSNCSNITVRNGGTFGSPIGGATNAPASIYVDSGNNDGVKVQNVFLTATRTSLYTTVNTSKNQTFERLGGTVGSTRTLSVNTLNKGSRSASNSVTGGASVYGTHVFDMFESDTVGRVWWAMNEPTAFSSSYVTLTLAGATGGFTSGGQVAMPTVGDQLVITMPYYAKGHTAFANAAATLTGTNTGNFSYEYALDKNDGLGFSAYQALNGANLSAETITYYYGFKLRLRITCTVASTTNALTYVRINTVSASGEQGAASYPLDTANPTLELTGLEPGTEIVVFNNGYSIELDREVVAGTTYSYPYEWISDIGNFLVYVLVWKNDREAFVIPITLTDVDQSIPLKQSEDLVYNGTYTPSATLDFPSRLQILGGGTLFSIPQLYSEWKDEIRLTNNAQYPFAYEPLGGQGVGGIKQIPKYVFQANSWKFRPAEANAQIAMVDGIVVPESGSPFVNTLGGFNVNVEFDAPVQAIAVNTGAVVAPTQQEIRDAMTLAAVATPVSGSIDSKLTNVGLIPALL